MNWKLIFFDLDGTLVDNNYSLSNEIINGINEIRQLGLRVAIATGRSQESAKFFLDELQITENSVVHNGSAVIDKDQNIKILSTIDNNTIQKLIQIHQQFPLSFKLHFPDNKIIKSNSKKWPGEDNHFVVGEVISDLTNVKIADVMKVVFYESRDKINRLEELLKNSPNVRFLRTHPLHMEMLHSKTSKSTGISHLMDKEEFGLEQVIAVGDQDNDYEMIRDAGLGIVVGEGNHKLNQASNLKLPNLFSGGIDQLTDFLKKEI